MEVKIYELRHTPVFKFMPKLLEKLWSQQLRTVVHLATPEECAHVNSLLWTYRPNAFIPHGSSEDGIDPAQQPIWLTTQVENPNHSQVFLSSTTILPSNQAQELGFTTAILLFDHQDQIIQALASQHFNDNNRPTDLKYWQENPNGFVQL